ncbi:MAG TPA: nucleoside transporter C-terminal domain-containing protein [Longimicrobiales bacterium]|nr:nucleoside transporter C-terminal domain-containing protein [Longimicrobiales bacterium]
MSSRIRITFAVVLLLLGVGAGPALAQAGAVGASDSVPAQATGVGSGGQEADAAGVESPPTGLAEDIEQAEGVRGGQPIGAGASIQQARADLDTKWYERLVSLLGLAVMLGLAWLMSSDRRHIPWRIIVWGVALQFVFALFILKTPMGVAIFAWLNDVIVALLGFTVQGASFLFGDLVWGNVPVGTGAPAANAPFEPSVGQVARTGAFFAFNVLPTIIFFSSLMTVLYYLGVMQAVVKGMAWVMMRTLKTSGAETLSAAGNIFVGQTEAPLLIKPFVERMTMSELNAVMVAGFATIAGGVMAAFVGILLPFFPDIAGHLIAASVMSAPAALVIAKLLVPETGDPETRGTLRVEIEKTDANVIDAAARGAGEGLTLALNVGAMLLAFIALIALINALLGWSMGVIGITGMLQTVGALADGQSLTLEVLLGWILAPLAWVMGVPWQDATTVGSLLGIKTVVNEFVAYLQLGSLLSATEGTALSPRSIVIATYALCGFANFSSIAIQIGGIGGIAPSRRSDLSRLGLRAMIGGTLAAFMTATIAGMVL